MYMGTNVRVYARLENVFLTLLSSDNTTFESLENKDADFGEDDRESDDVDDAGGWNAATISSSKRRFL